MVHAVDVTWFVIRSSHAVRLVSRTNAPKALCGRWGPSNALTFDHMPDVKSCESCLRIIAKREEL